MLPSLVCKHTGWLWLSTMRIKILNFEGCWPDLAQLHSYLNLWKSIDSMGLLVQSCSEIIYRKAKDDSLLRPFCILKTILFWCTDPGVIAYLCSAILLSETIYMDWFELTQIRKLLWFSLNSLCPFVLQ